MATVSSEELRMAMDFFGVDADTVLAMSDEKVARALEQYYLAGKLAGYEVSPPLPSALDWISKGLQQSASLEGLELAWRERGATVALTRDVGLNLAQSARDLFPNLKLPDLGELSSTVKWVAAAVIAGALAVVVFKVG